MRKLVYVGTNGNGKMIETTSYTEKEEYRAKGYEFHTRMDEVKEERTEEQEKKRLERIAKLNRK